MPDNQKTTRDIVKNLSKLLALPLSPVVGFTPGTVVGPLWFFLPHFQCEVIRIRKLFLGARFFLGKLVFQPNRSYLIVADESGYARFELFLSSQSISVCDFVVFSSPGVRIRGTGVQPIR